MKSPSLLAALGALVLLGAGCAGAPSAPRTGDPATAVRTSVETIRRSADADNGFTCSVDVAVPHVALANAEHTEWVNRLIDANAYGMLESLDTDTLSDAADEYLADCVEELNAWEDPVTDMSLVLTNEVTWNADGLFSLILTTAETDADGFRMTYAQGDLYDVENGEELLFNEIVSSSNMSALVKALFTRMGNSFSRFLDADERSGFLTAASTGARRDADAYIDTSDLEYALRADGLEFVFAQELWVPIAEGRVSVTLPWSELDPLLTPGTALAAWRE